MSSMKQIRVLRTKVLAAEIALLYLVAVPFAARAETASANENNGEQTAAQTQATATKSADEQKKQQPVTLQTMVVTGSAAPRSAADSKSPIDVLTGQDLVNTGQVDLATALRALLPSLNMPQADVRGSATANIRPAQLRGLSPDETLVLVNGKPFHTTSYTNTSGFSSGSSPVDLNSIPLAAVDRIEVLRDGASTLYGSAAIAGVINIILKGGAQGGSASVSNGLWDGNQGQTWNGSASDGFALGQNGWLRLSANFMRQNPTNEAGPDNRYPSDPTYGQVTMHFGLPYALSKQIGLNAQYSVGNATFYAFSLLSKREGQQDGTFRSLSQYKTSFPAVVPVVPEGYLPLVSNGMIDDNSTVGVRGGIGQWDYDFSLTTGGNRVKQFSFNNVNPSLGAATPRSFYNGTTMFREDDFNADFRRPFDVGLSSPLTFAWGLQYQYQQYRVINGDGASYYGVGAGGINPAAAGSTSRNDRAVYVDASADVTSKFSTEASARYEYYNDFGSNFSWGLKGRYAFTPNFAMRASYTTGFRAPSVIQEGYTNVTTTFVHVGPDLLPFLVGTFTPTSAPAKALGATPLKPERSRSANIGFVYTSDFGPQVTLDLYEIRVRDTIQWTGTLVGPGVVSFLQSQGIQFVNGVQFYTNFTNNMVRGADLVASWPIALPDSSKLNLSFSLSNYMSRITSVNPFPPIWATIGLNPALGRPALIPQPVTKGVLGADWGKGPWTLVGRLTRYSALTARGTTPAFDETYGARFLTDVAATYSVNNAWNFTLGSNNVLNVYPQHTRLAAYSLSGNIPYLNDSPFGYFGRYVYATIDFHW